MSVNNESQVQSAGATIENTLPQGGVYASLFDKINLKPIAEIGDLNGFEDNTVMAETSANARVTAAVQVFMQCLQKAGFLLAAHSTPGPAGTGSALGSGYVAVSGSEPCPDLSGAGNGPHCG